MFQHSEKIQKCILESASAIQESIADLQGDSRDQAWKQAMVCWHPLVVSADAAEAYSREVYAAWCRLRGY